MAADILSRTIGQHLLADGGPVLTFSGRPTSTMTGRPSGLCLLTSSSGLNRVPRDETHIAYDSVWPPELAGLARQALRRVRQWQQRRCVYGPCSSCPRPIQSDSWRTVTKSNDEVKDTDNTKSLPKRSSRHWPFALRPRCAI